MKNRNFCKFAQDFIQKKKNWSVPIFLFVATSYEGIKKLATNGPEIRIYQTCSRKFQDVASDILENLWTMASTFRSFYPRSGRTRC